MYLLKFYSNALKCGLHEVNQKGSCFRFEEKDNACVWVAEKREMDVQMGQAAILEEATMVCHY